MVRVRDEAGQIGAARAHPAVVAVPELGGIRQLVLGIARSAEAVVGPVVGLGTAGIVDERAIVLEIGYAVAVLVDLGRALPPQPSDEGIGLRIAARRLLTAERLGVYQRPLVAKCVELRIGEKIVGIVVPP